MRHFHLSLAISLLGTIALSNTARTDDSQRSNARFVFQLREQKATLAGKDFTKPVVRTEAWEPDKTAILV